MQITPLVTHSRDQLVSLCMIYVSLVWNSILQCCVIHRNTYSINSTAVTVTPAAAVPELLHGPFLSPQTSQIQFCLISRGGMNWSLCRV